MPKRISYRRHNMWFIRGRKDSMCGIYRDLSGVPKALRKAYDLGHLEGVVIREVA